jgi:hypothetical protein
MLKLYGISESQSIIKKYVMTSDAAEQIGKLPIQIKPEITVKKHILHFTIYKKTSVNLTTIYYQTLNIRTLSLERAIISSHTLTN